MRIISMKSHRRRHDFWRRVASAALCVALLGTNAAGALAAETPVTESVVSAEETVAPMDSSVQQETTPTTETLTQPETETEAELRASAGTETEEAETESETDAVYTLHLTHVFRFTIDGKGRNVSTSETLELTEADFEDGVCDLSSFVYDAEQLTVTEANPLSIEDFDENRQGGARIVYAVKDGWKVVRKGDAAGEGTLLRGVFQGALSDYEFVPANVIRINVAYKYSSTGDLVGIDAASPKTIEATPEKQSDGTYKVSLGSLPTKEGFRIVLDPTELNEYVKNPPKGGETAAELKAKLENGDFDVDIDKNTVYYYQETNNSEHTLQHPTYNNRYSTEYNQAWNAARTLTAADYTATAVGADNNQGANPLTNPTLEMTLTEAQLSAVLNGTTNLDITVYYRRNATWYTVNHWVPTALAGTLDGDEEPGEANGETYVRLDQETLQGRVGAMTRAAAKVDGVYEQLQSTGYSQKLIENTDTVVDIYYKAADSYRVIFDTNYTYIPRQQVALGSNVDFTNVTEPKRTGYTFAGWRYLNKDATPNADGSYNDNQYTELSKDAPVLTVNNELIGKAKLTESGGVLALHLYPKWEPATTRVRVILWTEDLTGMDDVQATASGGNTTYYDSKYANYRSAPVTHKPQLGTSDPYYSNMGSFTIEVDTDSSLLENNTALLSSIQNQVESGFKTAMGQASGIDVADFYTQAAFEIVHEEEGEINYSATTASADGKTTIYVYFTRNVYELLFTYYGDAAVDGNNSSYCVATSTNGYSFSNGAAVSDGNLNFGYSTLHDGGNNTNYSNGWMRADVISDNNMPVPKTITIKAKYGADLRDVWPVARSEESVNSPDNPGNRGTTAKMISWATTDGKYNEGGFFNSGLYNAGEPTIMGTYAAMSAEIIADPQNTNLRHNLVAYWFNGNISYYRNNHCYEVPDLDVTSLQRVSIYNNNTTDEKNFLYLVPTDNEAIAKYDFNDLMRVSYADGQITYNDPNGTYYAVRAYNGSYYAVARQVDTVSSNTIAKQNPSARLHMTRANVTADHSTQHADTDGAYNGTPVGTENTPYDLYFYYDRDRYTITYTVPSNQENIDQTEYTLGTVELPYGAQVTQEKYGFRLNYTDKNTNTAYGWTPANETAVCPDRAENGTAAWTFKGWALGPAGVNMQWTVGEDTEAEAQAGEVFAIESNLRLYAIWDAPTYTVTFHLNGGTVNGANSNIEEKISANTRYFASGTIPRPLRSGYTLDGWYVADENGSIAENAEEFDFDQAIAEDKHVAAKWTSVNTETFDYTVYYVTKTLKEGDNVTETVKINEDTGEIDPNGTTYYVLGRMDCQDEMFIANSSLNFSATEQTGYVPRETNQILTMGALNDTYNVIFYYDPILPGNHVVRFVEAGTETDPSPTFVKEIQVEADQTVVTPQSDVAAELVSKGYALVNKEGDQYTAVEKADALTWIDEDGKPQSTTTLSGDAIPSTITYLVQPIPYTITYRNALGSPAAADGALAAVTAAANTPVASAGDKNPTQYTTKDTFTAKNPARVYENGKWYVFSHWSLGTDTTEKNNGTTFSTLKVDPGTVGNLTFIANWERVADNELGSLTVSKTVAGNAGETDRNFNFTVTLSDKSISNTFGNMTFTNGVATFTLTDGETKMVTDLPAGITYTVAEEDYSSDGYVTTKTDDTGTIEAGVDASAEFTNTKNVGSLTVSKTVAGNAGETDRNFNFTVTLSDTSISDTFGDMTFADGEAKFTLKHGESKTTTGLPAGITYTVAEDDYSDDGYVTTKTGDMGTIAKDGTSTAVFTNTKDVTPIDPDPDDSSLTVKKEWILDDGGKATDSVTVVLLRDGKEYEKVELSDRNNWTLTWTGLSDGYTWTVDEVNVPDGFTAKVDQNGMIFTITNDDKPTDPGDPTDPDDPADPDKTTDPEKPTDDVPKTGDETNLALWLVLLGISGMGTIITLLGSKRKYKGKRCKR